MEILRWILFNYAISACIWILNYSVDNKQLHVTRTLNLLRHHYRPVLQILTAKYVSLQGLQEGHTNTRPTPLYTHWKTIADMVTLKMTWAATSMPHTTTMAMVQPLEEVLIDNARYNSNSYFNCHSYPRPYCDNNIWTGGMYFSPEEVEVYYEMLV